jgi:hypothetical protein
MCILGFAKSCLLQQGRRISASSRWIPCERSYTCWYSTSRGRVMWQTRGGAVLAGTWCQPGCTGPDWQHGARGSGPVPGSPHARNVRLDYASQ